MISPYDRNLIKGAIRRAFARSEMRRSCMKAAEVRQEPALAALRPRVRTWVECASCGIYDARSSCQVDHIDPVVPLHKAFLEMTMQELVDRTWCSIANLQVLCLVCHKAKSAVEMKERARVRKSKKRVK